MLLIFGYCSSWNGSQSFNIDSFVLHVQHRGTFPSCEYLFVQTIREVNSVHLVQSEGIEVLYFSLWMLGEENNDGTSPLIL